MLKALYVFFSIATMLGAGFTLLIMWFDYELGRNPLHSVSSLMFVVALTCASGLAVWAVKPPQRHE